MAIRREEKGREGIALGRPNEAVQNGERERGLDQCSIHGGLHIGAADNRGKIAFWHSVLLGVYWVKRNIFSR